ncbi:MAG: amino acid synthesis family protein [Pseudomonadota bacterium]
MELIETRNLTIVDDIHETDGTRASPPLRKVAVVSVLKNPFAGKPASDMQPLIEASPALGTALGTRILSALDGRDAQSYGKAGIVGINGFQEHANALLTTVFANPIRDAIGDAQAWISSFTKVAAPGESIDVPMNHKGDVFVRSHYDGMSLAVPGGPLADEIAIIFCVATGGRINARVGGLTHKEVVARS